MYYSAMCYAQYDVSVSKCLRIWNGNVYSTYRISSLNLTQQAFWIMKLIFFVLPKSSVI